VEELQDLHTLVTKNQSGVDAETRAILQRACADERASTLLSWSCVSSVDWLRLHTASPCGGSAKSSGFVVRMQKSTSIIRGSRT
jgi:hypothetical protein